MKVVLSTISEFHVYFVARELYHRGILSCLFTGQMLWRIRNKGIPLELVVSYPYFQTIFEGLARIGLSHYPFDKKFNSFCHRTFDMFVSKRMPDCDIFDALEYNGLFSGLKSQRMGARWVCRSPNAHVTYQERILREEHDRLGIRYTGDSQRLIEYACESYNGSDIITVPSEYVKRSFITEGISEQKIAVIPYGIDTSVFFPEGRPKRNLFNILYVGGLSIHKGIHDLLRAFMIADIPNSILTCVGNKVAETGRILKLYSTRNVCFIGHRPKNQLRRYYSQADILVLPSVTDAWGMVVNEAMACGCPVIVTENTGSADIVQDGYNGFIVPIRSPESIAEKLVWLYEHPHERSIMREAALLRTQQMEGWKQYGDHLLNLYRSLCGLC